MDLHLKSVSEIKKIAHENPNLSQEFITQLALDKRSSVRKIYQYLEQERERIRRERKRVKKLFEWERKLGSPAVMIAGVDEVGRGPLAGPVTAAAVILPADVFIDGLDDSKKIPVKSRERLGRHICQVATAFSLGWASAEEIDHLNILQASFLAMRRAIKCLPAKPDHILVDGYAIPELMIKQTALIKADSLVASVAAASIVAKIARDKYMDGLHRQFPCYGFDRHKGYPTKEHYLALKTYGPSSVHRLTFKGVRDVEKR